MANQAVWRQSDGEKKIEVPFHVGDTVRVHYRLIEHEKVSGKTKREVKEQTRERVQVFEGIVISISGSAENTMFTVRRIGSGSIGIERILPLISPWIRKLEVKKYGDVRRAKLYYLRDLKGKAATKIKEDKTPQKTTPAKTTPAKTAQPEQPVPAAA
jgi:large subunit ribosomal protein L19